MLWTFSYIISIFVKVAVMSIILYEELLGKEKLYISQEPQVPVSLISSYIHNE